MKRTARIELEELLNDSTGSEAKPDVELRDRILGEIPPSLVVNTASVKNEPVEKGSWGGWKWAAAASFVVVVGAYVAQRSSLEPAVSVDSSSPIASPAPAVEVQTPDPMLGARVNASMPAKPAASVPLSPEVFAREQEVLAKAEGRRDAAGRAEPTNQPSLSYGNESGDRVGLDDAMEPASASEDPPAELREETKKDLRALGYLSSQVASAPAPAPPPAPAELREEITVTSETTATGGAVILNSNSPGPRAAVAAPEAKVAGKPAPASRRAPPSVPEPGVERDVEVEQSGVDDRERGLYVRRPPVPDDVFFREYGVNPFVNPLDDAQSTFGLDVDTGSFSIARRYLADGNLPPAAAIRVEEFVQAMPFDTFGSPRNERSNRGPALRLHAEGAPTPFTGSRTIGSRYRLLRFAVAARAVDSRERKPSVLTFVVDTSGSMDREDRLGLVKRSLHLLLRELDRFDRVGLVIYDDHARVVVEPTNDLDRVARALDGLRPGGSTNAEDGLVLAYEVAGRAFDERANNRVILASDGVANVGRTGPESILESVGRSARRGIQLTTVGFGMGNYNDVLMEQLADKGDGHYAYVDTLDEARRVFQENLTGTLETVALDAKAQVEFDSRSVERYRLLGFENRAIADHRFRDDRVDAGEIGAGHRVTALYEVRLREGARREQPLATLSVRYRDAETRQIEESNVSLRVGDLEDAWHRASNDLQLAALAAHFAELLKGSVWARAEGWRNLQREISRLETQKVSRRDDRTVSDPVADLATMIARAARLQPEPERR